MNATTCLLLLCLLLPTCALADGLFLAVTEVAPDTQLHYWWASPDDPQLTPTDLDLLGLLRAEGLDAIDPRAVSNPPNVSQRVFGHPHLSHTNALNLASLYQASRVLTGDARFEDLPPHGLTPRTGARVTLDLHLLAASSGAVLIPLTLDVTSYADTPQAARLAAKKEALERLRALLSSASGLLEAEVGVALSEPLLVLSGLDRARPLVEIKRALKRSDTIDDAVERWAAEGLIAVEINPDKTDTPDDVVRAVDALLLQRFDGFVLDEVSRSGSRIELRVRATPNEAP